MWKLLKWKKLKIRNLFSVSLAYFLLRIWHFFQLWQFRYEAAVLWIFLNFYAVCFTLATIARRGYFHHLSCAFSRGIGSRSQGRSIVRATRFAVSGDRIAWPVKRNCNAQLRWLGLRYSVAGTIGSDIGSEWKCRQHIWSYPYAHCTHMRSRGSLLRNRQPPNRSDHTGRSACHRSPYSRFYFRDPAIGIPPAQQYRIAMTGFTINLAAFVQII